MSGSSKLKHSYMQRPISCHLDVVDGYEYYRTRDKNKEQKSLKIIDIVSYAMKMGVIRMFVVYFIKYISTALYVCVYKLTCQSTKTSVTSKFFILHKAPS